MASFFRGVTDALGFTKPKIPDSAVPQVNKTKYDIETKVGQTGLEDLAKWRSGGANSPTDPYFYKRRQITNVQPQYAPTAMPTNLPGQSQFQGMTPQQSPSQVQMEGAATQPQLGQYSSTVRDLLAARASQAMPTQEGFDSGRKQLALESLTRDIGTQKADAQKAMTERLAKSGILGSTVGARQLSDVGESYDRSIADALARVELEDLGAQREDRYRNLEAGMAQTGQLANLAGVGQGLELGGAEFGRTGRGIDRGTEQQNLQNALALAGFAREGGAMDLESAWKRYGAQREGDIYGLERGDKIAQDIANRAMQVQLGNIDLGRQYEQDVSGGYQDYMRNLLALAGGLSDTDAYSARQAQKEQMARQEQSSRMSGTLGLLGGLFGL